MARADRGSWNGPALKNSNTIQFKQKFYIAKFESDQKSAPAGRCQSRRVIGAAPPRARSRLCQPPTTLAVGILANARLQRLGFPHGRRCVTPHGAARVADLPAAAGLGAATGARKLAPWELRPDDKCATLAARRAVRGHRAPPLPGKRHKRTLNATFCDLCGDSRQSAGVWRWAARRRPPADAGARSCRASATTRAGR